MKEGPFKRAIEKEDEREQRRQEKEREKEKKAAEEELKRIEAERGAAMEAEEAKRFMEQKKKE